MTLARSRRITGIAISTIIGLTACGGDEQASRHEVVAAMTDTAIPDRWTELAASAALMGSSTDAWCASGDSDELTATIETVRVGWSWLAPFYFGPVMDRRSTVIVDPNVRNDDIDQLLDTDDPLDATALRELYGADQRGLQAVEYLADSTGGSTPTPRQCEYAAAAAALVVEEIEALATTWETTGPAMGLDDAAANDALEDIVNQSLFLLEAFRLEDRPEIADAKLAGLRWAMVGDVFAGSETPGATGITRLLDDDVVEQLVAEFDAAGESLDDTTTMNLERTITTNIVSTLGLSVQFSDADGDG